ncbi:hypothetical protein DY000_02052082 [Brassica cretica]|uniref:Uncharacterized protein n=1 Tax=Brassica cretica TaxID=69181 RepID=A0ABQ7A8F7_BRACR|nr:hypothetical protein DY000_02052082 [Brassica cretica]
MKHAKRLVKWGNRNLLHSVSDTFGVPEKKNPTIGFASVTYKLTRSESPPPQQYQQSSAGGLNMEDLLLSPLANLVESMEMVVAPAEGVTSPTVKKMRGRTTCYSIGPNIGNNPTDGAKRSLLKGVGPMVGV